MWICLKTGLYTKDIQTYPVLQGGNMMIWWFCTIFAEIGPCFSWPFGGGASVWSFLLPFRMPMCPTSIIRGAQAKLPWALAFCFCGTRMGTIRGLCIPNDGSLNKENEDEPCKSWVSRYHFFSDMGTPKWSKKPCIAKEFHLDPFGVCSVLGVRIVGPHF